MNERPLNRSVNVQRRISKNLPHHGTLELINF
jgi:hypothetical protein